MVKQEGIIWLKQEEGGQPIPRGVVAEDYAKAEEILKGESIISQVSGGGALTGASEEHKADLRRWAKIREERARALAEEKARQEAQAKAEAEEKRKAEAEKREKARQERLIEKQALKSLFLAQEKAKRTRPREQDVKTLGRLEREKQAFERMQEKGRKEKIKESEGLDIIPKGDIQEILKKGGKTKLDLKQIGKGVKPKDIVFIKPSEQEQFKDYADFNVMDFTKTKEGDGEERPESLFDVTEDLPSGKFAVSLKGDTKKVKEIGVAKDTKVQYAQDGSVLIAGGVTPVVKGMTQEQINTWRAKIKESAKWEGLDLSPVPYLDAFKEDGKVTPKSIYEGIKYGITKPLIIKDIPIARKVLPVVYEEFIESPVKGLLKTGIRSAERQLVNLGIKEKEKLADFPEWLDYDRNIKLYKDPDVQMAGITAVTLGLAGLGKVGAKILKPVGKFFQAHITSQAIKNPTEENLALALLFVAPEVYANRGKVIQEVSGKRPSQYVPNSNEIAYVSKTSRQRSTLMIKDSKGNYLVSKKNGISVGGDIKAKETPRQSVIRELKEELGLSEKDFLDIKFKEKIVTPEETFHVFETTLKPNTKLNPMDDMADGIKWVNKKTFSGVTGQTYRNPVMKDGVRTYELAIMNRLSGNKKPITWLGYKTKYGKAYFGTQSRYDVAGRVAKKYAGLKEEMLIHATPNIPIGLEFGAPLKIVRSKIKRGGEGLYVQPPISTKPIPKEVLKLEGYTGKGKPVKVKEIKDLPIKVGSEPPAGYVGLSYLDIGIPSRYDITFNPFKSFKRKGLYVTKGKIGKDIKLTKKALGGSESEQAIKFGREIKKKGRGEFIWIGGKKVRIREIEILQKEVKGTEPFEKVKKKVREKQKRKTEIDEYVKSVSPYKFVISKERIRKEPSKIRDVRRDIPRDLLRDVPRDIPRSSKRSPPRSVPREILRDVPRDIPREVLRDIPRSPPSSPPRTPPREPPKEHVIISFPKKKPIKQIEKSPSYDVMVKDIKRKTFSKVNKKPISYNDAQDLKAYAVDKSIARTSYLEPRQEKPSPSKYIVPKGYYQKTKNKYRDFRQRKGKRYKLKKDKIIERGKHLIDSKGEKQQLDVFKLLAKREKKRIKKNKPIGLQFA